MLKEIDFYDKVIYKLVYCKLSWIKDKDSYKLINNDNNYYLVFSIK